MCTLNVARYIGLYYFFGWGVGVGGRILNFTICLGLGKKWLFLGVLAICRYCLESLSKLTIFFLCLSKVLGIFWVLQESG